MANFIHLTKKFSQGQEEISINPLMISYIENRDFQGKSYSEVGIMGGKSFEVNEESKKILSLIEKASHFRNFYHKSDSDAE